MAYTPEQFAAVRKLFFVVGLANNGEDCSQFIVAADAPAAACIWRDHGLGKDMGIPEVMVYEMRLLDGFFTPIEIEWEDLPQQRVGLPT